jgi:Fe-S oxidoreductase
LLSVLIRDGKLRAPSFDDGSVTMHDPCYLGRVNNETDAPRRALGVPSNANEYNTPIAEWLTKSQDNGNSIAEPKHKGRKTLCCGAGGGRMWMEEDADKRPSDRRTRELLATGAKTIAVACPFCRIMLDTSVGEQAQLLDIVELVAKSNQSDG